jgi:hypothetical protein
VAPSQLADSRLFDFADLQIDRAGERAPYEFAAAEVNRASGEQVLQFFDALSIRG